MIDEFFNYSMGELEYRSLKFTEIEKDVENWQGNAVLNYPDKNIGYIRSIEHKHFLKQQTPSTIISYEFSIQYQRGMIPFYPIKTKENQDLYIRYTKLAKEYPHIHFSGRLGEFRYYDMDDTIMSSLELAKKLVISS